MTMKPSLSDFRSQLLDSISCWKLFVDEFPAWMPADCIWSTENGISASYRVIEKSINGSDGEMVIFFHDDEKSPVVRKFLKQWLDGTSEPGTGRSRPMSDLRIKGRFVDERHGKTERIVLCFPRRCNLCDTTPSCHLVYYTPS